MDIMTECVSCLSVPAEFTTEMLIHFPGLAGLNKSPVLAYPKLRICLNCGRVELALSEEQKEDLRKGLSSYSVEEACD